MLACKTVKRPAQGYIIVINQRQVINKRPSSRAPNLLLTSWVWMLSNHQIMCVYYFVWSLKIWGPRTSLLVKMEKEIKTFTLSLSSVSEVQVWWFEELVFSKAFGWAPHIYFTKKRGLVSNHHLYTLNVLNIVCQLYLNKAGKKTNKFWGSKIQHGD